MPITSFTFAGCGVKPAAPPATWARQVPRCRLGRRALGVDYGLSRVGLAVSVGVSPRALSRVETRDARVAAAAVAAAARENVADEIVLGLPLNATGARGEQAERTLRFAELLARAAPTRRILLVDERFTSQEADARLANRAVAERRALRDSVAAAAILERYFAESGEAAPEVFYEPQMHGAEAASTRAGESGAREGGGRQSFEEWRKERMRAAAELAAVLARGKGVKRKRKGKKR